MTEVEDVDIEVENGLTTTPGVLPLVALLLVFCGALLAVEVAATPLLLVLPLEKGFGGGTFFCCPVVIVVAALLVVVVVVVLMAPVLPIEVG